MIKFMLSWAYNKFIAAGPDIWFHAHVNIVKIEDLKVLRHSPDLLYNVKIGQGQLQLIKKQILFYHIWGSVRIYAIFISKYATKTVGTQKRQVACIHGTQDQKQSTFNTFKPAQ